MVAGVTRKKLCIISTSPLGVRSFLLPHIRELSVIYDITLIVNMSESDALDNIRHTLRIVDVPIARKINLVADLVSLFWICGAMLREKFYIVHSTAPKAGLLGMLAAWLARVPYRVHWYQGEVWQTRKGFMRGLLMSLDKLVGKLATHRLVVSKSEKYFLVQKGIIAEEDAVVLADGSICGVDTLKFKPDPRVRNSLRASQSISQSAVVLLFLGRLNKDKGVWDLFAAFQQLRSRLPSQDVHLMVVGPDEEGIVSKVNLGDIAERVHFHPYTQCPEHFMAAADVLILPSYREGFGMVVIEAAACGIPAIASRIYGITDALADGTTGLFFEPSDVEDLAAKMEDLVINAPKRDMMGKQAYKRCLEKFNQPIVTKALRDFYTENFK